MPRWTYRSAWGERVRASVHSSRAGDGETTTVGPDDRADGPREDGPRADGVRADGPRADGLQEELSPGNRVRADRAVQLQMEEEDLRADQPTD